MLDIVEFPSNLGLVEPVPGKEPGVKFLPAWLRVHGLYDLLNPVKVHSIAPPPHSMKVDKESGVRNANEIANYAKQQAELLEVVLKSGVFILAIGGDCSILIGNTLALKHAGNFALFFLDGHTDFGWPSLSQTGGAAGMDLAIVTGYGHDKLSNIGNFKPYINETNVWCVGNRDYDKIYVDAILQSAINYYDLKRLRETGIEKCCHSFLKSVEEKHLNGFWIHLDVDVLHDEIMPAVDSREPGGLTYKELKSILEILLGSKKSVGMEITILDPDLDPGGKYAKKFIENIGYLIKTKAMDSIKEQADHD